jgi:dihydroneopterin aldolase
MVILIIAANLGYLNWFKKHPMKYQTTIKNLEFFAYHGLYEEEKVLGGLFLVDVLLETEVNREILTIDHALNYESIYKVAAEEMKNRQDLIETVAQRILIRLTEVFREQLVSISVTVSKPNPGGLFGSGAASVTFSS